MERRKGERHIVPEIYRKYIILKVRKGSGEFVPMELLDFSPRGIRIRSSYGLLLDSAIECLISAPRSITKEIPFVEDITRPATICVEDETIEAPFLSF
jgi:hypothetical protein